MNNISRYVMHIWLSPKFHPEFVKTSVIIILVHIYLHDVKFLKWDLDSLENWLVIWDEDGFLQTNFLCGFCLLSAVTWNYRYYEIFAYEICLQKYCWVRFYPTFLSWINRKLSFWIVSDLSAIIQKNMNGMTSYTFLNVKNSERSLFFQCLIKNEWNTA